MLRLVRLEELRESGYVLGVERVDFRAGWGPALEVGRGDGRPRDGRDGAREREEAAEPVGEGDRDPVVAHQGEARAEEEAGVLVEVTLPEDVDRDLPRRQQTQATTTQATATQTAAATQTVAPLFINGICGFIIDNVMKRTREAPCSRASFMKPLRFFK